MFVHVSDKVYWRKKKHKVSPFYFQWKKKTETITRDVHVSLLTTEKKIHGPS